MSMPFWMCGQGGCRACQPGSQEETTTMTTIRNDTFGDLTRSELAELRACAHPCIRCSMLADVDPVFHAARYGHRPAYRDDQGHIREFWPRTRTWTITDTPAAGSPR